MFPLKPTRQARRVLGVQKVVGLFAARFAEELVVDSLNGWALVRLTDGHAAILGVHGLDAPATGFLVGGQRLTAAADAPTGAGHDFEEVHFLALGTDAFEDLACIGKSVHSTQFDLAIANEHRPAFDPAGPRRTEYSIRGSVFGSMIAATVRRAASIMPPVTPKIRPAPVASPSMGSKAESGRVGKSMSCNLQQIAKLTRSQDGVHLGRAII